jgi:hypothetical protein
MATVLKKSVRRQRKSAQKGRNKASVKAKSSNRELDSRAEDAVQRKKIGKMLDVPAFLAHHRQNSASTGHWEVED